MTTHTLPPEVKPWPLFGYAPGHYHCKCATCETIFEGDKRAVMCLDCAARTANKLLADRRAEPSGEGVGAEADLRTLVPDFRLDWSGLRNRLEEFLLTAEKQTTFEMRSAHLDELARVLEDAVSRAVQAARPLYAQPLSGMEGAARYRHKKRGSEYLLIGFGKMQAERWVDGGTMAPADAPEGKIAVSGTLVDMREVAIYRSVDDDSLWARPREEFEDGRFELLSTPVSAASPEGEAEALAWFAKNICLELSWGPVSDDEGDQCQWCVHERRGNVNDQEWELVGHGDTPIAAINDARHAASPSTQEKNHG